MTSDGKIHWSCQTEDGSVTPCSGNIGQTPEDWQNYAFHCIGSFEHAHLVETIGDNPDAIFISVTSSFISLELKKSSIS